MSRSMADPSPPSKLSVALLCCLGEVETFSDTLRFLTRNPCVKREEMEADTLLAFVSMGGDPHGSGKVDVGRLKKVGHGTTA